MAVSGLIMIGYLLAHMYGNLKVFAGPGGLRRLRAPPAHASASRSCRTRVRSGSSGSCCSSPSSPTCTRASCLWRRDRRGAGRHDALRQQPGQAGHAANVRVVHPALGRHHHPAVRDLPPAAPDLEHRPSRRRCLGTARTSGWSTASSIWWLVVAYTIAMLAVGFHLRHGVWSALTTLGANTSAIARRRLNLLAYVVAIVITVGFLPRSLRDPVRSGQLMSDAIIDSVDADSVYVDGDRHRRHQGAGRPDREALGRAPVQRQAGQPGQPPQADA